MSTTKGEQLKEMCEWLVKNGLTWQGNKIIRAGYDQRHNEIYLIWGEGWKDYESIPLEQWIFDPRFELVQCLKSEEYKAESVHKGIVVCTFLNEVVFESTQGTPYLTSILNTYKEIKKAQTHEGK